MEIEFRQATENDLELLLAWRSHPKLYGNFYLQKGPLDWDAHREWWFSREHRRDWIIVLDSDGRWRDVGSVNVSDLDTNLPEVGVYVGEITLWGQGVATDAVAFAVDWAKDQGYPAVKARILESNEGSRRVFESLGFRKVGAARENEYEYRKPLR